MIYRIRQDTWLFHPFFLGEKSIGLDFEQDIVSDSEKEILIESSFLSICSRGLANLFYGIIIPVALVYLAAVINDYFCR